MTKFKIVSLLLFASLSLNIYLLIRTFGVSIGNSIVELSDSSVIYSQKCPETVTKNRLCSIQVLEKRSDFAMVRVHYHYVKGEEDSNRIVIKANKGSHDNVIGTRAAFHLVEGDNFIDIPFGMYQAGSYTKLEPYMSKYIMVQAQGIAEGGKRYTASPIFEVYANYDKPWYTEGERTSWQ